MAVGLVLLLDDPDPPHPPDDGFGILRLQLEFGREDHRLVEIRLAVGEAEVVALADLDLVGRVEDRGPADELADRPLPAARVAASAPPTVPGMPVRISRPASPARAVWEIRAVRGTAAPALTTLPSTATSEKKRALQLDDQGLRRLRRGPGRSSRRPGS